MKRCKWRVLASTSIATVATLAVLHGCGGRLAVDEPPSASSGDGGGEGGTGCSIGDCRAKGPDATSSTTPDSSYGDSTPEEAADAGTEGSREDSGAATFPLDALPCLSGGNVIYFDGDPGDPTYAGKMAFSVGPWSSAAFGAYPLSTPDGVQVSLGNSATIFLYGSELAAGQQLDLNSYLPFLQASATGGAGCKSTAGRARIDRLSTTSVNGNSVVTTLTMAFARTCGGSPVMRGCVHYER